MLIYKYLLGFEGDYFDVGGCIIVWVGGDWLGGCCYKVGK